TGIYTPLKMDFYRISEGHSEAEKKPIGVITNIKKESINETPALIALAALWRKERPEDVSLLKQMIDEGNPPTVSWEITYNTSAVDESGVEELQGTVLTGVAIVSNPAYSDRTRFLAMAAEESESEKWTRKYINSLPDDCFLYIEPGGNKDEEGKTVPRSLRHLPYKDIEGNIDGEHLRNAIARLSQENTGEGWLSDSLRQKLLNKARKLLQSYNKEEKSSMENEQEFVEYKTRIQELETEIQKLEAELQELRAYKEKAEAEKQRSIRLNEIKQVFAKHGIERPQTYFEENAEKLLSLDNDALEFFIQEFISLNSKQKETSSSVIPNTNVFVDENQFSIRDLAAKLRNLTNKGE
ncbi:MAG: hypothetical protein ACUVRK_12360, partial [Spirochaetota bacterium]